MPTVDANPTKAFFVHMLTRDIELADSVLDLIDNSIDGVVRTYASASADLSQYFISLHCDEKRFEIADNCGGIPRDIAEKYAFRFGRPTTREDDFGESIGAYGIGMKRAIFKMGRTATVSSETAAGAFIVAVPSNWLENESWTFNLEETPATEERGTVVEVTDLHASVQASFADSVGFVDTLRGTISRHYSRFIVRGLKILLNERPVVARGIEIIADRNSHIEPYVFKFSDAGVDVAGVIGFARPSLTETEIDAELESPHSRDVAGISIVCNNRIVLYADRSYTTGWGLGTTPRFHGQFANIGGFVAFSSREASKLPLTTTKRGVDTDSSVYQRARELTSRGIKRFTDYTNKWKGRESPDRHGHGVDAFEVLEAYTDLANAPSSFQGATQFEPTLPLPIEADPLRTIAFRRTGSMIDLLIEAMYGERDAVSASALGSDLFDRAYSDFVKDVAD